MTYLTVYLPIELDNGPYCPDMCVGSYKHRSTCTVFWRDLNKAVDRSGKSLRTATGKYVYLKCDDCQLAVKQAALPPPDKKVTIPKSWKPPPDIFYPE